MTLNEMLYRTLATRITLQPSDRVLLLSAQFPLLARDLAGRSAAVEVYDTDFRLLRQLERSAGQILHVAGTPFPNTPAAFDTAIIINPKGRDFGRALLWSAYEHLAQGGTVYLLGANDSGIKSLLADAGELFTSAHTIAHKNSHRIGSAYKAAAGVTYPAQWGEIPTQIQTRRSDTPLGSLTIGTMPGVFSWQGLDDGTRFLLAQETIQAFADGANVLDVGCGTGIIGCALGQQAKSVQMVDINLLAVACASASIHLNSLPNARAYASDIFSEVSAVRFDLIVSNPPFHQGFMQTQDITRRMIAQAPDYLQSGGRLVIVANAFLPYEPLMQQHLINVQALAQDKRYKVLVGQKR